MTVEERVRAALRADADRMEVPRAPEVEDLPDARRLSPWRVGLVAAALVLAAVLLVDVPGLPTAGIDPIGLIDPVAPPSAATPPTSETPPFDPGENLSYLNFDGPDVFASGTMDGYSWSGAARLRRDFCIGASIRGSGARHSGSSCGSLDNHRSRGPITVVSADGGEGGLAVAGWVTDEVSRVVWELPDGPVELELIDHPDAPGRVFAGAGRVGGEVTLVWAYDAEGTRLGAAGVSTQRLGDAPTP